MENKTEWYVLQVYANSELAVKRNIEAVQKEQSQFLNIKEIFVPIQEITSISPKGKKTILDKAIYAGYVYLLVENYIDKHMSPIRNISKVSQILGKISDREIAEIKAKVEASRGKTQYRVTYEVGSRVVIRAGSFENFKGEVTMFNPEDNEVTVAVDIFGRNQDVTISIQDVEPTDEEVEQK